MTRYFVFVSLLSLIVACDQSSDPLGPDSGVLPENGPFHYTHDYFPDEECPAGINCFAWLDLCPDGTGEFVVTDILNAVTWTRNGDVIAVTAVGPGDIPGQTGFAVSTDGDELTDDAFGLLWRRKPLPEFFRVCD